jgi:hypothetical protein
VSSTDTVLSHLARLGFGQPRQFFNWRGLQAAVR